MFFELLFAQKSANLLHQYVWVWFDQTWLTVARQHSDKPTAVITFWFFRDAHWCAEIHDITLSCSIQWEKKGGKKTRIQKSETCERTKTVWQKILCSCQTPSLTITSWLRTFLRPFNRIQITHLIPSSNNTRSCSLYNTSSGQKLHRYLFFLMVLNVFYLTLTLVFISSF